MLICDPDDEPFLIPVRGVIRVIRCIGALHASASYIFGSRSCSQVIRAARSSASMFDTLWTQVSVICDQTLDMWFSR